MQLPKLPDVEEINIIMEPMKEVVWTDRDKSFKSAHL